MSDDEAPVLKILQQTVDGSEKLTNDLKEISHHENVDIVVIHKPPLINQMIPGYQHLTSILTGVECDEETPQTVVAIFNEDLQLTNLPELSDDNCIFIQMFTPDVGEFYLISLYCPPEEAIDSTLNKLERLVQFTEERPVIICADTNAKSLWWSNSEESDSRGEKFEDFIIRNSLCVINRKDAAEPLSRSNYTDVTLVSTGMVNRILAWEAMEDGSLEEKRTIGLQICLKCDSDNDSNTSLKSTLFNYSGVDSYMENPSILSEENLKAFDRVNSMPRGDFFPSSLSESIKSDCKLGKSMLDNDLEILKEELDKTEENLQRVTGREGLEFLKDYYMNAKKVLEAKIVNLEEFKISENTEASEAEEKPIIKQSKPKKKSKLLKQTKKPSSQKKVPTLTFKVRAEGEGSDELFNYEMDAVTSFQGSTTKWEQNYIFCS